jgi:hypothetical protein
VPRSTSNGEPLHGATYAVQRLAAARRDADGHGGAAVDGLHERVGLLAASKRDQTTVPSQAPTPLGACSTASGVGAAGAAAARASSAPARAAVRSEV